MRFSWTRVSAIVHTFCVRTSMWLFHTKLKAYVQVFRFVRVISCAMAMQPCSQVWALRSNFCTPPWVPLRQSPNCTALAHLDTHQCKTSMQKSSGLRATTTTTLLYTTLHNTGRYDTTAHNTTLHDTTLQYATLITPHHHYNYNYNYTTLVTLQLQLH